MAIGNTLTCDYAGFMSILGISATFQYLLFLIYFFWRRVKFRVSSKKFAYDEERYIHLLICLIALTMASVAAGMKSINPTKYGSICILNASPFGCGRGEVGDENYVECTRGKSALNIARSFGIVLVLSVLCLLSLLSSITCHVYSIERTFSKPSSRSKSNSNEQRQGEDNEAISSDNNATQEISDANVNSNEANESDEGNHDDAKKETLTRKALNQSILYIMAIFFTFAAPLAFLASPDNLNQKYIGTLILWLNSTLFPTYGIFLILIYTRPKVKVLSEMYPKASWILCFKIVLFSGGEVPPAHELHSTRRLPPSAILPGLPEAQQEEHALSWPSSGEPDAADYEEMLSSMMATSRNEDLFGQLGE